MTSIPMPPAGAATARVRQITIETVDARGEIAAGAEVRVFLHGLHAGTFTVGADTVSATVEIDDPRAPVRLVARFENQELSADLGRTDQTYLFRFRSKVPQRRAPIAEARCPDGTTGRPCVTCAVAGTEVRICV